MPNYPIQQIISDDLEVIPQGLTGILLRAKKRKESAVLSIGPSGALSSGSVVLAAGNNITLATGPNQITIEGPKVSPFPTVVSALGTDGAVSNGTIVLVAGNNVTLSTGPNSITIEAASAPVPTDFSLNGTSSSVSLIAGANVGFASGASSITISADPGIQSLSAGANSVTGSAVSLALFAGNNISLTTGTGAGSLSVTIHGESTAALTNFSLNGTSSSVSLLAGANITINSGASSLTIVGPSVPAATNFSLNGTSSSVSLVAGSNISLASGASSITIHATSNLPGRLSYTEMFPLAQAAPVSIALIDSTGTSAASATNNPFGSSLSLQRLFVPAPMNLSEVQLAFGIAFPATNQGQGTMSQTLAVYYFGNSTSLASVLSASRSASWATGTTTSGTASSLQQGWAGNNIQPMTFASSLLTAGEYAFAHLLSWAAESTSWTLSVYGANALSSLTQSMVTNLASGSLAAASSFATASSALTVFTAAPVSVRALSTGGLLVARAVTDFTTIFRTMFSAAPVAVDVLATANGVNAALRSISAFGSTTGTALTAFNAAPTVFNALSSSAVAAGSGVTGVSSYGAAFLALSTAGTATAHSFTHSFTSTGGSAGSGTMTIQGSFTNSVTAKTYQMAFGAISSNSNLVSSIGAVPGSIFTATASGAVISNAGTAGVSLMSGAGLVAGSFLTASSAAAVLSNASTAAVTFVSDIGTVQGSFFTSSASASVLSNVSTGAAALAASMTTASFGAMTGASTLTAAQTAATAGIPSFAYNGSFAMTTNSTDGSYLSGLMLAAVMRTGSSPASIALSSSAVIATGSLALVQPWFALCGA